MPDDGYENGAGRRPFDGRPEDTDRRPGLRDATRRFAADDGLDDEWDQWLDPGEGAQRRAPRAAREPGESGGPEAPGRPPGQRKGPVSYTHLTLPTNREV